jgi:serine/threonine protein phosphatase PrpC
MRKQENQHSQASSRPVPSVQRQSHVQLELRNRLPEAEGSAEAQVPPTAVHMKLGGCADPNLVSGSIVDEQYVRRQASVLGSVPSEPFGATAQPTIGRKVGSGWEVGATSVTGIRDSNEDAYLVVGDLLEAFRCIEVAASGPTMWEEYQYLQSPSLFAIFDGHCGDQAARYTAEFLLHFLREHSIVLEEPARGADVKLPDPIQFLETTLEQAVLDLDRTFCELCVQDGRDWESGTTALVATLFNDHLVIANLGDARGVFCKSVTQEWNSEESHGNVTWNVLFADSASSRRCVWSEVTDIHSPSRYDERCRIERANGWVTLEKEIPVGQLKRMALFDQDVVDILKRCVSDHFSTATAPQRIIQISRVCGELAVSRAIGDRDFKAQFNTTTDGSPPTGEREWDSSALFLPYPNGHSRTFVGDLVSNKPDFRSIRLGEVGVSDEFLLLACDGLWDVMDADDAVRLTRDLLYVKRVSAKLAANRLAELAVHLGSSDNVTIIVLRFFDGMGGSGDCGIVSA